MAKPFHQIPDPDSTVAGRNNQTIISGLRRAISLWRPRGAREPGIATLARFAHRLIASDGKAFTADELAALSAITNIRTATEGDPRGSPAVAASATLDPAGVGADNSFVVTAVVSGSAGNGISVEIGTPADQSTTTVSVVGAAITVTPGTKARMLPDGFSDNTPIPYYDDISGKPAFTSDGEAPGFSGQSFAAWDNSSGLWYAHDGSTDDEWTSNEDVDRPDLVGTWTPSGSAPPFNGFSALTSSAQQAIDALNGDLNASTLVVCSSSLATSGELAAVAITHLSGGIDAKTSIVADFIGQLCRVGDSPPYDWYRAETLTSWVPIAIGGAPVSLNADQSAYQALVVSGSNGSEVITITTI